MQDSGSQMIADDVSDIDSMVQEQVELIDVESL